MLKARFALSACFVLALLGAGWCAATYAGKPAPPPPPPPPAPGKIYYAAQGIHQMNGDGSGKTAVPFVFPSDASALIPSLGSYGGGRWWLTIRELVPNQTDLYATKDGSDWIQLTASSITANGDGTETHVRFYADPCWSSDGSDEFCSVKATYYVHHPATGGNPEFYSDIRRVIYQLDISASALEAMGPLDPDPMLSVADIHEVSPIISAAVISGEPLMQHHWSADAHHWPTDAGKITFVSYLQNTDPTPDLYVADVSDLSDGPVDAADATMIFPHTPNTYGVSGPSWSPIGTQPERIAFDCGGYVYTVWPDGTHRVTVTPAGGWGAFWSPDGNYIAYRVPVYYAKGWTRYYDIARIPSAGGAILTLTADIDRTLNKSVLGWSE